MRRPALVLLLLVLVEGTLARADDEVQSIRRALAASDAPERRIAQIPRLVANGETGAATLLGWLVGHDPTLAVRIGAAQGLGRIRAENATALLLEHLPRGGPRALRDALATSLARKKDGARRLMRIVDDERRPRVERGLLLAAMAAFDDESTRERLVHYAIDADYALRFSALRALAAREDAETEHAIVLGRLLAETRDEESLRELLDVLETALHPTMKPALVRLQRHHARDVAATARRLLGLLPARPALPPARPDEPAEPDDRYGRADPPFRPTLDVPPTPPAAGSREDLVLAFDATGSAHALLPFVVERARHEIRGLRARVTSARVGVIVYRGGHGRRGRAGGIEVLPLTFDLDAVLAFLAEVDTQGTDDRGAALAEGLRQALDLSAWRWTAARRVRILADTGCDEVAAAERRVADHFRFDATTTAIAYFLRTRTRVPEDLEILARAGGTEVVEALP